MISQKVSEAINGQIVGEFASAALYLSMAAHFEAENLQGFARWMRVQAQEEASHGIIFFNFLCERGGRAVLRDVDAPPSEFGSPQEVFKKVKDHERKVSEAIDTLADLAVHEKDHATRALLDWFVTEQVEEQATTSSIHARLKLINGDSAALFMLDKELGQRAFIMPPPLAGKL